ncbi:hypothetical protein ACA910_012149 [Epithemia clementina (nom. ined.)]
MLPPHLVGKPDPNYSVEGEEQEGEEVEEKEEAQSDFDDVEDDDVLSLTPPPSLPVLLISLERLLGYKPSTKEEVQVLEEQVKLAIWGTNYCELEAAAARQCGNDNDNNDDNQINGLEIHVSQEFEPRVSDLFETGVAVHSDNSRNVLEEGTNESTVSSWITLQYPNHFCRLSVPTTTAHGNNANNESRTTTTLHVVKTERLWKRLLVPRGIEVVDRLLQHLRDCNRCLTWKVDLYHEIGDLVQREEQAKTARQQQTELLEWRLGRRKQQLEQLYQVRDTLEHRTEMARIRFQSLEQERSALVAQTLRQQRIQSGQDVGLEALDFASTSFQFPSGNFLLSGKEEEDEDDYYEEDGGFNLLSDPEEGDDPIPLLEDEERHVEEEEEEEDGAEENGEIVDSTARMQNALDVGEENQEEAPHNKKTDSDDPGVTTMEREWLGKSKQGHKVRANKKTRKEAAHEKRLALAQEEEAQMTEACTSQEMKVAQGMMISLEERLARVDELIETLQEEEWADEENGIHDDLNNNKKDATTTALPQEETQGDESFTLLDQILAMIMSATSPPPSQQQQQDPEHLQKHMKRLLQEHQSIVAEWKSHFGRLPPPIPMTKKNENGGENTTEKMVEDSPSIPPTTTATTTTSRNKGQDDVTSKPKSVTEMRQELGIQDMDNNDWENNDDDDDDDFNNKNSN